MEKIHENVHVFVLTCTCMHKNMHTYSIHMYMYFSFYCSPSLHYIINGIFNQLHEIGKMRSASVIPLTCSVQKLPGLFISL